MHMRQRTHVNLILRSDKKTRLYYNSELIQKLFMLWYSDSVRSPFPPPPSCADLGSSDLQISGWLWLAGGCGLRLSRLNSLLWTGIGSVLQPTSQTQTLKILKLHFFREYKVGYPSLTLSKSYCAPLHSPHSPPPSLPPCNWQAESRNKCTGFAV